MASKAWLVVAVMVACSSSSSTSPPATTPPATTTTPPPPPPPPPAVDADMTPIGPVTDSCAADADCTYASYPDPAKGCCPHICGRQAVTRSRAREWELAYRARCTKDCPRYDCAAFREGTPVCRDGRCVGEIQR